MWLINTTTLRLEQVVDEQQCRFVILSHTWMPRGEVTFQDMEDIKHVASRKPGFEKITKTCEFARCHRCRYAWIDTCCIDKTSSAELSEAINSMFRWYQKAEICYVFLSDFDPLPSKKASEHIKDFNRDPITWDSLVEKKLRGCRWFTRGWTLQELIAPRYMNFFDKKWNFVGTKSHLSWPLCRITNIEESILRDSSMLHTVPVARRMSWAAGRETTRTEDMAYCLLGIFNINMPMLYGEGQKAFMRLQQQIASENADLSLFAWQCAEQREYSGLFADSPKDFAHCSQLRTYHAQFSSNEIAITNIGVRLNVSLHRLQWDARGVVLGLKCVQAQEGSYRWVGILLKKHGQTYVRWKPFKVELSLDEQDWSVSEAASPIYVVPRLLPADVQRLSALGDITIVLRHNKNLSDLLASSEGHPAAAYFPDGLPVKRRAAYSNASVFSFADRLPIGMTQSRFKELTGPSGGAVFRAQDTGEFIGLQIMDFRLGPLKDDRQRLIVVIFLLRDGVQPSFGHAILSEMDAGPAGKLVQRISQEYGWTEQQRLEEVRNYLVVQFSDPSGSLKLERMPSRRWLRRSVDGWGEELVAEDLGGSEFTEIWLSINTYPRHRDGPRVNGQSVEIE